METYNAYNLFHIAKSMNMIKSLNAREAHVCNLVQYTVARVTLQPLTVL